MRQRMLFQPVPQDTNEPDALRLGEAILNGRHARLFRGLQTGVDICGGSKKGSL
jgi:hypothetical protein